MKNPLLPFLITVATLAGSCGNNADTPAEIVKNDTTANEPKAYFPVSDFIKSDISYADTFFTAFIKYNIHDNKTDSSFLKPAEFKQLAAEFITNDLSKETLEKNYKETSFIDNTTGTATFTYSTTNASLSVQRVDVIATPGEGYDKISSIYIEKTIVNGDTTLQKKMFWKVRKNFQVITETTINGQSPTISRFKVVWDASE